MNYCYGAIDDPKILKHTTAHHHRQWLETVNDLPQKALSVEIYNCCEYERSRLNWNGCGLLLHEYCHLVHQVILEDGLNNVMIIGAFGSALESGLYDDVLRRDWAFYSEGEDRDAAYATINHKEFFSELSVAFLSRGYDGCLSSSGSHSNATIEDCSPPMMAPDVIERMKEGGYSLRAGNLPENLLMQMLKQITSGSSGKGHCNKFFPFTHGQLKGFDPITYAVFQQAWSEIANWDDPALAGGNDNNCMGCISFPLWNRNTMKNKTSFISTPMKNDDSCTGTSSLGEATDTMSDQDDLAEDIAF